MKEIEAPVGSFDQTKSVCILMANQQSASVVVRFSRVQNSGVRIQSHDATLVLEKVRVLVAQSLFGPILL